VEPELTPQVLPVLTEYMKGGYLALILRELCDGMTSIPKKFIGKSPLDYRK